VTFARITLGLDGSPHAEAALSHAIRIARATKGLVRGIHVVDRSMLDGVVVADLSGSVGFQPFLNLSGELHDALVSAGGAILAAVATRIAAEQSNISHVNVDSSQGDHSTILFEVQVRDRAHLARLIRAIRQMPDVMKVERSLA